MKTRFALLATTTLLATPLAAQDLIQPIGEGPFSWDAFDAFAEEYQFDGETLVVLGASTGADKDKLDNLFAYFEEATGATVQLSGSESFEQDIVIAAQSDTLPDIAMFPQPGLAADMARRGVVRPLDASNRQWFADNFAAGSSWADLVTFEGPDGSENIYGTIFGADVKSLVWYSPENFDEAGYDIPQSMEELKALTQQIVDDGGTPWCIGLGSGAATGWPATDWVEEFVLRTQPPEVYDQWVTNEIPFDDPRIVAAIEEYGWFARNDDFVPQDAAAVATSDFRDSPAGLFSFPPECYMHRQASFIPNFFPEEVEVGTDVDFFYFPAYADRDLGQPILGSGGVISVTSDREIAQAFIEFLKLPTAHEIQISQGQFLTPHLGANTDAYANDTQAAQGEILTNATTFRFDGSDLMPGEIGTSAFWQGMVDYQTGASAEDVAAEIQNRWSQIR
ncbi:ABC transporter substrate-binding protein [Palleronia pelagia]|uniref:Maltose-binding protein/trehalose-binding protein/sucrose-binding protein n=1 Tax=Palleronia pelagia TaxID=387096 RepID=A0A1H8KKY1_9RHOB|nr:ABC transporter substrate-binding protein [Palleronia pelagia]SEN93582.1 maltose-binding protein/trehalose-binding protein/sucrose-binding protein [Palleronia pelagia]